MKSEDITKIIRKFTDLATKDTDRGLSVGLDATILALPLWEIAYQLAVTNERNAVEDKRQELFRCDYVDHREKRCQNHRSHSDDHFFDEGEN